VTAPTGVAASTVRDALQAGAARLGAADSVVGADTPRLDAEVLLRHVLGLSRAALFTHPERRLTADEEAQFWHLVDRRAAGEPVAYLTGRREFMGLELAVTPSVLIPRPETELLVERALAVLQSGSSPLVADVGTGSGAIALSLAHSWPACQVVATDRSAAALAVARVNVARVLGAAAGRVRLVCTSLLAGLRGPFGLIAANLPYIPAAALDRLPLPVRRFEPRPALDGGPDGLDLYRALLADAPRVLASGGTLLMECDPAQAATLMALVRAALPAAAVLVHRDLAGHERVVEATSARDVTVKSATPPTNGGAVCRVA
jgi:release factor glutamine methyltransferase